MGGFVTAATRRPKKGRAKWLNVFTHRCNIEYAYETRGTLTEQLRYSLSLSLYD